MPTEYKGFDVLEVEPNRANDPSDSIDRATVFLDQGIGKVFSIDNSDAPIAEHSFDWFMDTPALVQEFRDFVTARRGMAVPFWVPTWREDLTLAAPIGPAITTVTIQDIGYSESYFATLARRYIAIMFSDGTFYYRKILGAVDNGNGTETLTIDDVLGVDVPIDTLISFLLFCRLSDDEVSITWVTSQVAEATLTFTELPPEVPA